MLTKIFGTIIIALSFIGCKEKNAIMEEKRFINIDSNIKLWVETYGNAKDEACIFINGAGANSSFWSDRLCADLVKDEFYVIKYDHRDFGYSSKIDFENNPFDVMQLAKDAITILDSLSIKKAHIVGQSMGGFITQLLAIHFPERVLSFTSISSSTSSPDIPLPPEETWKIFLENKPTNNLEKDLDGFIKVWKHLNGTAYFDEELAIDYTRNLYKRQDIIGAIGSSHVKAQATLSDRSKLLQQVQIPALIMHGEEDYLVDKLGGIQTFENLKNAKLVLIPEMGHIPFNKEILIQFENEIKNFLNNNHKDY